MELKNIIIKLTRKVTIHKGITPITDYKEKEAIRGGLTSYSFKKQSTVEEIITEIMKDYFSEIKKVTSFEVEGTLPLF